MTPDPAVAPEPKQLPLAARIWGLVNGYTTYFSVRAADELGVFEVLSAGALSAKEIARRCGADEGRMLALLGGNVAAGTLERISDGFSLSELAAAHLVRGQPGYLGALVRHSPGPLENWPVLAGTVRGSDPVRDVDAEGGAFFTDLAAATFPAQLAAARAAVASLLDARLPPDARVLDLGAGAAPWTVAILESRPEGRAVVNDLDAVVPVAERHLAEHGLSARSELLVGDYWKIEIPPGAFDVVVLANVCRSEGDEGAASLVRRAAASLVPGGLMLVAEYLLDDDLSGPPQAQLLGLTMVANTRRGSTFTKRQALAWLGAAQLEVLAVESPLPPTSVIVGRAGAGT